MIVRTRSSGCECTGNLKFAGSLTSSVNRPGFAGLPCRTAICAPLGIEGTGLHLTSAGVTRAYSGDRSCASATHDPNAATTTNKAMITLKEGMLALLGGDSIGDP